MGADLVNHCVNDILAGAEPLFFSITRHRAVVTRGRGTGRQGVARAENGFVADGGETAEMPGFYADGE